MKINAYSVAAASGRAPGKLPGAQVADKGKKGVSNSDRGISIFGSFTRRGHLSESPAPAFQLASQFHPLADYQ